MKRNKKGNKKPKAAAVKPKKSQLKIRPPDLERHGSLMILPAGFLSGGAKK